MSDAIVATAPAGRATASAWSRYGKTFAPYVVIAAVHAGMIAQLVVPGVLLRMSDFVLPYFDNSINYELGFYSWSRYATGLPTSPGLHFLILHALTKLVGMPAAQQIVGFAPLPIAGFGMYALLRNGGLVRSKVTATIGAVIYSINWSVLSHEGDAVTLLTVTGMMYTYALIPWVMLFAHRLMSRSSGGATELILVTLFTAGAFIFNLQALVIIPLALSPIVLLDIVRAPNPVRQIGRVIAFSIGWVVLLLLLAAPSLGQFVVNFFYRGLNAGLVEIYGLKTLLIPTSGAFRVAFPNALSPLLVLSSPVVSDWITMGGAMVPMLFVVWLAISGKLPRDRRLQGTILMGGALATTAWILIVVADAWIGEAMYRMRFIGVAMQALKTPNKFLMLLVPSLVVTLAIVGEDLFSLLARRWRSEKGSVRLLALTAGMVIAVAWSGAAIVWNHQGLLFRMRSVFSSDTAWTRSDQGGKHFLPFGRIQPPILAAASDLGLADPGANFRVLWLPSENEIWQQTGQAYIRSVFSYPTDPYLNTYQRALVANLSNEETPGAFAALAAYLNVRYIVVLRYVNHTGPPRIWGSDNVGEHIVGDPVRFLESLREKNGLRVRSENADYVVFEVQYDRGLAAPVIE